MTPSGAAASQENFAPTYELTIVTVCRNAEAELLPTIKSVLWHKQQGQFHIEHLIVDGASTDNTSELLCQLAEQGRIESYISEPDTGIYHAMNKGINLARGKVLYFLNAGDRLLETDLAPYLLPILHGESTSTAGPVITDTPERQAYFSVWLETSFLGAPVCHQGFFCSAAAYKALGGYDQTYRCIADAKFMCACISTYGYPAKVQTPAAYFPENGFSQNCSYTFLNEFIRLRSEFLPNIIAKAKSDRDYLYYAIGSIGESAFTLIRWIQEYGNNSGQLITLVQEQCRKLRKTAPDFIRAMALWWIERTLLSRLGKNQPLTSCMQKILPYAEAAILPPLDNFHARNQLIRHSTLRQLLTNRVRIALKLR